VDVERDGEVGYLKIFSRAKIGSSVARGGFEGAWRPKTDAVGVAESLGESS
jgi:hypothetical protein